MKKKGTQSRRVAEAYFGPHFDARRTKESHGDPSVLLENHVSASMPAGSTYFDALTLIARSSGKPIPVKFLSEKLKKLKIPRGGTYFGEIANDIEAIVVNNPPYDGGLLNKGS